MTDERPPIDFPESGDFAVIRSVGALIKWDGHVWRWTGAGWVKG